MPAPVTTYAYDANNRLLSETVGDTATAYTYDANGNTLTAGDKTYTYNTRGQQTGYSNGTTAAAYAYNPSGLRNVKTVGGSTKYFVYNGMNIVYEYTESVADGVAYFYGLNRTHNSEGEIYLYNAHGDVVQLVKNNAVVASYTYDAFGNLTSQIGESDNPFLYCGEYYDAETQTYYLRARYYNPANGRFTQQDAWAYMDASDPLSLNLYAYCGNNPIMYVDPSGNFGTAAAAWGSSMFWLCAIDAALPIGDIIYGVGLLIAAGVDVVCSIGVENTANLVDSAIHIRDAAQQGSDASKKKGSTSQNNSSGNGNSPRDPNNWNHRDKYLKQAKDEKLRKIINELYRPGDKVIGDGGTADMLRYEFDSGGKLAHLQKAQERIVQLERLVNSDTLESSDLKLAYQLINDLYDAVKYVGGN